MNANALIFGSGFMMLFTSVFFLHARFSMMKRKAVRVRVRVRDSVNRDNRYLR
ncbi:hypothetical protein JTF06_06315 [Desemzia sp. RIT804]|uniref:hypothetical protein n=1 Tax=Desemzia sp. RIT 804 TaxID=2810209 RepID=UPI0019529324|nr:hypothetical protein [Desemzia sp. RIT 804]MBM6614502.1 hypothetical protein [Desemzia sp. RIT 804]